jgi:hypothetical protein
VPTIKIIVPLDRNEPAQVSVSGVVGPSCEKLTEGIEAALGRVEHREHTYEYLEGQIELTDEDVEYEVDQ